MNDYPNLNSFLEKHRLAQSNKSKDVRFTIEELNDAVHDIHKMMASVSTKHEDNTELKNLLKNLLSELKQLSSAESDGGKF
jgi:hypothetical protein